MAIPHKVEFSPNRGETWIDGGLEITRFVNGMVAFRTLGAYAFPPINWRRETIMTKKIRRYARTIASE